MTEEKAQRISELKQSDLNNIDCMEIVSRTDCNKQDLIKVQDIINQNVQMKADKEALVNALKDFISAIDSDKVILASEYEQAKQTLEKNGK